MGNGNPFGSSSVDTALLAYLEAHQSSYKFLVATENSHSADGLIINSGRAVMAWGGFSGTDPAITLAQFKTDVAADVVRYVYLGESGMGGFGGNQSSSTESISSWVAASCSAVSGYSGLYDCSSAA